MSSNKSPTGRNKLKMDLKTDSHVVNLKSQVEVLQQLTNELKKEIDNTGLNFLTFSPSIYNLVKTRLGVMNALEKIGQCSAKAIKMAEKYITEFQQATTESNSKRSISEVLSDYDEEEEEDSGDCTSSADEEYDLGLANSFPLPLKERKPAASREPGYVTDLSKPAKPSNPPVKVKVTGVNATVKKPKRVKKTARMTAMSC
jgi:hypothetical protein